MGLLRVRPWPQKGVGSLLEAAVSKHQQRHTGSVDRLGVDWNREDKLLSAPTKLAIEVRTSKSYPGQQKIFRRGWKEVRGGKRRQPNRH